MEIKVKEEGVKEGEKVEKVKEEKEKVKIKIYLLFIKKDI
jgi:hypothetical protein